MVATVGVLALQGGVEEHLRILDGLGVATRRVRVPRDLDGLDGLVIPGGESSVIDKLARSFDLAEPLRDAAAAGLPVLATCAGLIYCARELDNPAPGQQTLGLLDVTVRRNAFGNQRFSAERTVDVVVVKDQSLPIEASFIRAPLVTRVGEGVEVIATVPGENGDAVVGVRQGRVTALSFHPEENGDARVHAAWLDSF
ncbi:pyridoxal 5'-phosphate synthase glutaminase subunit PdxT [Corynebacterium tuberculostearicum]|uniref:pyridoxal 5'-phosphate synthase glutaminase subunit PdxT n=1 Tax=Corynebacterium tuberculostearicum TaxID=38304 RepID=UPI002542FDD5|nr:pyridoxal 5'-phosphate synthase glutaminase subunit PdxT [Corynebacterium tuberculostearicum]MDK4230140.1 pyridoxal 5'-phosphate synthase glutaminase subunit PdxT [Corynebacterium tuberculostearicum]